MKPFMISCNKIIKEKNKRSRGKINLREPRKNLENFRCHHQSWYHNIPAQFIGEVLATLQISEIQ